MSWLPKSPKARRRLWVVAARVDDAVDHHDGPHPGSEHRQHDGREQHPEVVVRERPDDPQALAMLGAARFQADDPLGAASAFRRLVALRPDDGQAWARLGESLVRANDDRIGADAEAAFREAVRHDPDQLGARFFLGEAALRRGDAAQTRAQWRPLIAALDPSDPRRQDLERRMPPARAQ